MKKLIRIRRTMRAVLTYTCLSCVTAVVNSQALAQAPSKPNPAPADFTIAQSTNADAAKAGSYALDVEEMARELQRLDAICEQLQLPTERRVMGRWLEEVTTGAYRLHLPLPVDPIGDDASQNVLTKEATTSHSQWLKHFTLARQRHARFWVSTAQRQATEGDEWSAYRSLWRAVREDPDNADAKRVLSPLLLALNVRSKPRVWRTADPQLAWSPGSYSRLDTANFQILSRADANVTSDIARQLEQFYALWTQIFYPLWAPPNVINARLAGRGNSWTPRREFRVVVCKDRKEYLEVLGAAESNIGVSVGYYNTDTQLSFFYPGDQLAVTLFHELTHQLLAEGSQLQGSKSQKYDHDFWMVEGIALYMESLVDCGNHWQVGGWTAPRLQAARYRGLHDGYWIDWDAFTSGGREQWKADVDIGQLYTQAAGLTHYFLDPRPRTAADQESGRSVDAAEADAGRAAYYAALVSIYQGQRPDKKLQGILGEGESAHSNYLRYLRVDEEQVRGSHTGGLHAPEIQTPDSQGGEIAVRLGSSAVSDAVALTVRDLVLTRSQLSSHAWQEVSRYRELRWLDVSFSNATSQDLRWLEKMTHLERLSLEGTAIDGDILNLVARLPKLKELDLAQCPIDDDALTLLSAAQSLETLWLSGTKVSDKCLATLAAMPKLKFVSLDQTQVPSSAAQELNQRLEKRR